MSPLCRPTKERKKKEDGMAYFRKRKGKWLVQVKKKGYPRQHKTFFDKLTARKWAREIESQMDKNIFEDYSMAQTTTLKDILIKYRDEITIKKKGYREETCKINKLINHKIAMQSLARLKSSHIYKLKSELSDGRKVGTVNKYIFLLSHAYKLARTVWNVSLPKDNPFDLVSLDRDLDCRDRVLMHDEYKRLLKAMDSSNLPMLKDAFLFSYMTGVRQGELLKLNRKDINFNRKVCTLRDTKNSLDRTIPLPDKCISIIKKYPFGDIVFNIVGRRLRKHFLIACRKAKIENFRWHDTRACFATNALMSGMSIAQVSTITGHKNWSQLKRYTRIKAEDLIPHVNKIVSIK